MKIKIHLPVFENSERKAVSQKAADRTAVMEFHIRREQREEFGLEDSLFSLTGNVILADIKGARELARKINAKTASSHPERTVTAGQLNAMGLIDEILHYTAALYREQVQPGAFDLALSRLEGRLGSDRLMGLLTNFNGQFPPRPVYAGKVTVDDYLASDEGGESRRALTLEEIMLLALANLNPAFKPFLFLFDDRDLKTHTVYSKAVEGLKAFFAELPPFGPDSLNLWDLLRSPALSSPDSLYGQLEFIRKRWGVLLGTYLTRLLMSLDVIKEETKPSFFGPGPAQTLIYEGQDEEYERFSPDQEWMPKTVLIAKSTLVWLYQLSQKYGRPIERLDQIPDEELDLLARRGFTGLWLIGLWERSTASRTIKQWTGNPEAAASAYSLYDYDIAGEIGGWESLANLRDRCFRRGIRLGSDMVPNHTGIDSRWIMEKPDRFLQLSSPPFPTYSFTGGNLSNQDGIGVYIEDHYYSRSDAAVVFKRVDFNTGDVRYIYHGNDGTSMPWNDTAQIDFLNPEAREAVIRTILGVCQQFSIVRFDAAMTLAKRHIQRLWYPEPGRGGDIASRAEHALSNDEFNRRIPNEFWREVVDRCAAEAPHTLLLAEAFWMMEGYFVRTLGMHRVYNSAFMNMLKNEENAKYRATIKNTLEFDPEVLKRFVNFMNNPDEETAVAQFGRGDKYFGICTLLVTMPGLPMFGHGQIEGFEEKYGMEYRRSYRDEKPDQALIDRHEREIFPLMKKRYLFSGSAGFCLFDFYNSDGPADGSVNENVFAYTNHAGDERAVVVYNNAYERAVGRIRWSCAKIPRKEGGIPDGTFRQDTLHQALGLHEEDRFFVLFQEQRRNLWYIRSSKDVAERGLSVVLNGYEAQIFLAIHEVEDANGQWAQLNTELNGRGVPDLSAAIMDMSLGELYFRFTGLFKKEREFFQGMVRFFADGNTDVADTKIFMRALQEPVLAFAAAAARFIAGNGYEPFTGAQDHAPLSPEEIWAEFSAYLSRLIKIAEYTGTGRFAKGAKKKTRKKGEQLLRYVAENIAARPGLSAFAAGYGILALLRPVIGAGASGAEAAALAAHWQLDRKLREAFTALGIPADEAYRVTEIMRAALARTVPASPVEWGNLSPAAALIAENYEQEDFRRILGVNRFDDVTWFKKEAFDEALFYAPFFLIHEAADEAGAAEAHGKNADLIGWIDWLETIAAVTEHFQQAEAVSGYRLDKLLEAVSKGDTPKAAKPRKAPAKKPAQGKKKE
ncbi:MAG: alpha-amylase [Spirochaetaceae bacterium]|jgi:glycosidase|nr:alpha-amylase [Spirochaetaceae bacterium]